MPRFFVYVPAFGTFHWTDDMATAETIIAAHWGAYGEVCDGATARVLVAFACHDATTINAARKVLHG